MKIQDLKYLLSFSIPFFCYLSITHNGIISWLGVIFPFVFIPIVEQLLEQNLRNDHINDESEERKHSMFFDLLLFFNLPLLFVLLFYGLNVLFVNELALSDIIGKVLSIGILLGACGINVAHELGHKQNFSHQATAKLLLTPCLYNHFTLQHNRGHHLNVGTPLDPATSRKNEVLYSFWWRSARDAYKQAWQLESMRLARIKIASFSIKNEMIWNTVITLSYLALVYVLFDGRILGFAVAIGIISFLLLETINYIEHYGLTRKMQENGRYEKVEVFHSWNSDHQLGRIILYELTRHADHHYKANKKYQTLLHYDESPQLPYGYPASLLISLVPALWFRLMNPLLEKNEAIQ